MDDLLAALRATAEPTRLRALIVLAECELTVGELCRVLGQSQPRVSRHLRLLTEAGLLDRQTQGTSVFYRPAHVGVGRNLLDAVLALVDLDHSAVERDLDRLAVVRAARAEAAASYFESIADDWDALRNLHIADEDLEHALLGAVEDLDIHTLLDVGTGTGRVLELFAPRIGFGIGIDLSPQMLNVARSRLDDFPHCTVRQGDAYGLDLEPATVDVVVLHHVLHFLDDPRAAIAEAARTLRPGGRLLIVDFAEHDHRHMGQEFAHRWLGLAGVDVANWCRRAGIDHVEATYLEPSHAPGTPSLTTVLWVADMPASSEIRPQDLRPQDLRPQDLRPQGPQAGLEGLADAATFRATQETAS